MNVTAIKTSKITRSSGSIFDVLDASITELAEYSIVLVTSKIVSICEGSVVAADSIDKDELIKQQAKRYLPKEHSEFGLTFTITDNSLIPTAGIDESNGEGYYILWPKDVQASANAIRAHLCKRFGLRYVGVIITDSTSQPMRRGVTGTALAHSGFDALNNYMNTPDIHGKYLKTTHANIAGGLAAAGVLVMGEGNEQTPLCIITDAKQVVFQDRNPSAAELAVVTITPKTDIFAPFLNSVPWQPGEQDISATSRKNS